MPHSSQTVYFRKKWDFFSFVTCDLQPAELCLEMQATAGQRANQSKTDKEKTNLQREQESSIMEYKNKFT